MKKTFYAREDYVGKVFKINEIYFDEFNYNYHELKKYDLRKAYVKIIKIIDTDIFIGKIFIKTIRGELYLDGVNPVEVELCSGVFEDTLYVYITNNGDGLLVDVEKHEILNSMENPKAPPIIYYMLGMKEDV